MSHYMPLHYYPADTIFTQSIGAGVTELKKIRVLVTSQASTRGKYAFIHSTGEEQELKWEKKKKNH